MPHSHCAPVGIFCLNQAGALPTSPFILAFVTVVVLILVFVEIFGGPKPPRGHV